MMKLYWSPRSPFVRKVMVAAREKGLADQIICIRTVLPDDGSDHVLYRDNPLGRIPTLVLEDGRRLHGSSVICEYFDLRVEKAPMFPAQREERLRTRLYEATGDGLMETATGWMFERFMPTERSPVVVARHSTRISRTLDALDESVDRLHAEAFDAGSIAIAVALSYLDFRFASQNWRANHRELGNWFEKIAERSSMRETKFHDDLAD